MICPIQVGDEAVFVMKAPTSAGQDLPTCMLCDPPMVIGKPAFNESERQRALRNHAAAHLLSQHSEDERCAFCCQTNCQLNLDIADSNVNNIRKNWQLATTKVDPGSYIHHNCNTFPSMEPFQFKFCKPIRGFP